MLLSTVYRVHQHSGMQFGVAHTMDIVRGKRTEKVLQHSHQDLSCFGVGQGYSEAQLRSVMRQLVATEALGVDAQAFNTLYLTDASRAILKGTHSVTLRHSHDRASERKARRVEGVPGLPALDAPAQARLQALKAWRAEVARTHNLPAYVIFHDATLHAIAHLAPSSLEACKTSAALARKNCKPTGTKCCAWWRRGPWLKIRITLIPLETPCLLPTTTPNTTTLKNKMWWRALFR
jgi:ATP-dependent DNA helicase RecQ